MPEWRKRYEKVAPHDGDDDILTGTIVMGSELAEDIKQIMEDEKNEREEQERREDQKWKENR